MTIVPLESMVSRYSVVGSVLHGAYGDYYEQIVCLRQLKRYRPELHLVLFFASKSRFEVFRVFDLSFADEVYLVDRIADVPVDRFLQFQINDRELRADVLAKLPSEVLAKFDLTRNLKPWTFVRAIYRASKSDCDIPLSPWGRGQLSQCFIDNGLDEAEFVGQFTVGFVWRYRRSGDFISPSLQTSEDVVLRTKSALLSTLADEYGARIVVAGMDCRVTDENRERTDCKFAEGRLAVRDSACVYLKGLNWGLELEIMRRCSLCIAMASGFSEGLLMKREGPTILVDPPVHYLVKLIWNRMPFFGIGDIRNLSFYLRQPHTADRVMRYLRFRRPALMLPIPN